MLRPLVDPLGSGFTWFRRCGEKVWRPPFEYFGSKHFFSDMYPVWAIPECWFCFYFNFKLFWWKLWKKNSIRKSKFAVSPVSSPLLRWLADPALGTCHCHISQEPSTNLSISGSASDWRSNILLHLVRRKCTYMWATCYANSRMGCVSVNLSVVTEKAGGLKSLQGKWETMMVFFIFSDLWIDNLSSMFIFQALHVSDVQPWSHALQDSKKMGKC